MTRLVDHFERVSHWLRSGGGDKVRVQERGTCSLLTFHPYGDGDVWLELMFQDDHIGCVVADWAMLARRMAVSAGTHGHLACGGFEPRPAEQALRMLQAFSEHGFAIRASVLRQRIVRTRLMYDAEGGRHLPGPDVSAFSFMGQLVQRQWPAWQLGPLGELESLM